MQQLIQDYLKAGLALVPIPSGSKGPTISGWNELSMSIIDVARASEINGNVGIAHAYCKQPTMALDIDDYEKSKVLFTECGVNLDSLINAQDSVGISSGRPNRKKLLYKLPPNSQLIETFKLNDSNGTAILEFRCASKNGKTVQDVLPPSIHPETGKSYQWSGSGHWSKIPVIPSELMTAYDSLRKKQSKGMDTSINQALAITKLPDITTSHLRSALLFMRSDGYELWIKMGLCLKPLGDTGRGLWFEWSATSPKFDPVYAAKVWESLKPTVIDYRSVFSEAQKMGWANPAKRIEILEPSEPNKNQVFSGFTAEELSHKTFPPLAWVVQDILPEGCYILSARPKVGKSWLALQTCLGVAFGTPVLGKQVSPGKAVYLALEDNPRRLQDRLAQLKPDGYATPNLVLHTNWLSFDNGGLEKITELIQLQKPKILVIDTLAKVRPKMARNSSVYESDYNALAPLTELANRYRCCILVITHNRKGKSDVDALEQVSGSLGLTGAVDGALVIDGVRTDKHYKLSLIGRDIPNDDELAISRKSNGEWEILGQANQVFISEERKEISELLKLHPKGLKPKEISDLLGKKPNATRRLLTSMLVDMQVISNHGIYTHTHHSSSGGNTGNSGNGV